VVGRPGIEPGTP